MIVYKDLPNDIHNYHPNPAETPHGIQPHIFRRSSNTLDYNQMKRTAFQILLFFCDRLGLNRYFRARNSDKVRILMYHAITEEQYHPVYWLAVHIEKFRAQMRHLAKCYAVVPASALLDTPTATCKGQAVITFDDGLENIHTVARPVLQEFNFPAICFVIPGLADKQAEIFTEAIFNLVMKTTHPLFDLTEFDLGRWELPADTNERAEAGIALNRVLKKQPREKVADIQSYLFDKYAQDQELSSPFKLMTVDQIKQFASEVNFEVGAHTDDHIVLTSLSPPEQRDQIEASTRKIKDWGIAASGLFCYPSGGFNDATIAILKQVGIKGAVTTTDGLHAPADDRYRMKRISIGADTTIYEFKARLSGLYYLLIRMMGSTKG